MNDQIIVNDKEFVKHKGYANNLTEIVLGTGAWVRRLLLEHNVPGTVWRLSANGMPDKTIVVRELDLNSEIHVYEHSKKVFIMGKEYTFKDVLACSVSSQERIEKGNIISVTGSDNGSVAGRAIVGGIIAGPAGAIIGGSTADKRTEISQDDDKVVRDYTVNITMNSITDPIINIHTGEDVKLTNEVVSLMNVIIANK